MQNQTSVLEDFLYYFCLFLLDIIHTDVYKIEMHSRDIIKKLEKAGWKLVSVKGSHHQFKHPSKLGRVTVAHPKRDIPLGTLKSIIKQAGIDL